MGRVPLIIALTIATAFYAYWIDFMRLIWPVYMQLQTDYGMPTALHSGIYTVVQGACIITLGSALFSILYIGKIPFIEKYRSSTSENKEPPQWPWESMPPLEWRAFFLRSISFNLFNLFVCTNFISITFFLCGVEDPHPTDLNSMPSTFVFIAQSIFCMIIEDFTFYISHRALHLPKIYPMIHKIHHENKVPYTLSAIHTHPLEYIFGNILPMMAGPTILFSRMHRASMFGWYFIRACETIDAHCGYTFPWSPFRLLPF